MAEEQDAVLARALHEDEAQRRADISELAEKRGVAMIVDELKVTG